MRTLEQYKAEEMKDSEFTMEYAAIQPEMDAIRESIRKVENKMSRQDVIQEIDDDTLMKMANQVMSENIKAYKELAK